MTDTERSPSPGRRPVRKARVAAAAGVALALVAGVAYAAELGPFAPGAQGAKGPDPEATARARAFLSDWAAGRTSQAAQLTSSPGEAERVLRSFTVGLDISEPTLTPAAATVGEDGTVTVPFTAKMPVADLGTWTYTSALHLRRRGDDAWKVDWTLSLVHPKLSSTEKFHLKREDTGAPEVVDRKGAVLPDDMRASLSPVLAQLPGGTDTAPRGAIQRVDRATGEITGTEVTFGKKRTDRPIATTIDPAWQAAADKALAKGAKGRDAALIALRIDNGEILAVANAPASGFNRAVSGTYAPGSTFKLVTSSALLLKGAVKPEDTVHCPKYLTVGKEFHNVGKFEHRGATFREDFAESCNTAFIGLRDRLGDRELGEVAGKYFGIGQEWHIGIPSIDGAVPAPGDETEKAASMIGQGRLQANPLIMASVTATAVSGRFHQPAITRGAKDTTTTTALPQGVVTQLRDMMRATVTDGTARALAGLPGDIGAKTGTAEVDDDDPNNGWLVAHRGNVAIACVVEQGDSGGSSALPVVHDLLAAVPDDPS
jgi:Penicillin binding protein transpeptidase domain/NTF2-like N-terminal transpeptidase domain